jgi:DNA-binding ferritin-like protein
MPKVQNALAVNGGTEKQVAELPVLILEKQLTDTLKLLWHVQQVRIRSTGASPMKTRVLFEGLASELQRFVDQIRNRRECWRAEEPHILEIGPSSYWRLFAADSIEPREQFEALLCGFAHYARQTTEAITSLNGSGDPESSELLAAIFKDVERSLWFLEIYFEGLALNTDSSRLPDWSASALCE